MIDAILKINSCYLNDAKKTPMQFTGHLFICQIIRDDNIGLDSLHFITLGIYENPYLFWKQI